MLIQGKHVTVGAIIEREGKIYLMDRSNPPFGFACPAGHVEQDETPDEAVVREVKEETRLDVVESKLLYREYYDWNKCTKGGEGHYFYVYKCDVADGEAHRDEREAVTAGWYTPAQVKHLTLERVWGILLRKYGII